MKDILHMDLDIKIHGDSLEKEFSDLIKERIPHYELIWKNYIGHDGKGKMLQSKGLDKTKEKKRVLFAEYHYTCLESIVGLYLIICKIDKFSYNSVKDLILQNNDIIAFYAHVGRIRDCIKKIGEQFGVDDVYSKFNKWWGERCVILHGKKLPIAILEGIYLVLKDVKLIKDINSNEILSWNDFDSNDFDFLNDNLSQTFESIISEVDSSLAIIYGKLKDEFKTSILDDENFNLDSEFDFPSDVTYTIISQSSAIGSDISIFDNKGKKK